MNKTAISVRSTEETSRSTPRAIVAIPVRNEADRIVACLGALADQAGVDRGGFGVLLFLNNCTDTSATVIRSISMPWQMRVIERDDPAASAGWARRAAMSAASAWLAEGSCADGIILTTDADSRVPPDWVADNLTAIAAGADLVAGRISLDPAEAALLPDRLHARGRLEAEYEAMLIEIDARLDPAPGNPWPCHWCKSGATLAVRRSVFLKVGGMPDLATGEDRAFVDAVRARDFVVRHACDIDVVTSGRLDGRAAGGVADTIKLRCEEPESPCDDRLEFLETLIARAIWRRRLRRLHREGRLSSTWRWAPALSIGAAAASAIAASLPFGEAYAAIEAASPRLVYRPVRPKQLPRQIRRAARVVWVLRIADQLKRRLRRPPQVASSTLAIASPSQT